MHPCSYREMRGVRKGIPYWRITQVGPQPEWFKNTERIASLLRTSIVAWEKESMVNSMNARGDKPERESLLSRINKLVVL